MLFQAGQDGLEDGMGASVEAVDWNVEGITSSAVDASDCCAVG